MADSHFIFLPLGAIIQSFKVKGLNIVQGFPTQDDYVRHNSPFFGETIGRYANRISDAKIQSLNGEEYLLAANEGPNHLHGGKIGWGKRIWDGPKPVTSPKLLGIEGFQAGKSVVFTLLSDDNDEGYPGKVEAKVTYTMGTQRHATGQEVIVLIIDYEADLIDGADETAINLTNHSYFNLSGNPTITGTTIKLPTAEYLAVTDEGIPTGGLESFRDVVPNEALALNEHKPDIDRCFVLNLRPSSVPIDTRKEPLRSNLKAYHPDTGIHLEVLSTEPAFHVYTGAGIEVPSVDGQSSRGPRSGFCCEPGRYINAINVPQWRSQVLLKKCESYGARIVYRAWADEP